MGCLVDDSPVLTAASDFPELCLEWLPIGGPGAAGGDWCDLTPYTAQIEFGGGRQYEIGQFQPLSLKAVLKDAGRTFDVENTAGPFYPYLKTLKQIRFSAVYGDIRYPLWWGLITDFGDAAPDDAYFEQTIDAKDSFIYLDQIDLNRSWFELEVLKDRPTHWWPLSEQTGANGPIDQPTDDNKLLGFYSGGAPTLGTTAIVPYDGGRTCTTWNGAYADIPLYTPESGAFSIEGWFQIAAADLPASSNVRPLFFLRVDDAANALFVSLQLHMYGSTAVTPGQLEVLYGTDTGSNSVLSTSAYDDGEPHHFVVTLAGDGTVELYVDGASLGSDSSGTSESWFNVSIGDISVHAGIGTGFTTAFSLLSSARRTWPGSQSHLMIYDGTILPAARVAAHYTAGATGFSGDTTGERIDRILDYYGWPSLLRDIDTGSAILGAHDIPSGSLLNYLQTLSDTELGALFMDGQNRVVFKGRYAHYTDTRSSTSQATFGDGHSAAAFSLLLESGSDLLLESGASLLIEAPIFRYRNNEFSLRKDETLIRNPVTCTRQDGVSVTVEDTDLSDPETGYGRRDWSAPTSLESNDTAMYGRAHFLLARFKSPVARLANMVVQPRTDTAMWAAVLGMSNQDRITVERTPLGSGSQISADQYVESIKHVVSPKSWDTTIVGAPTDDTDYLIVGSGLVGTGRVG